MFIKVDGRELNFDAQHDIKESIIERNGKKKAVKGRTKVVISCNGKVLGTGNSYCSVVDQFTKKEGFKRALKRALEEASLNRIERTTVWNYFRKPKAKNA